MAEYTTNFNLEKQQANEYINIDGLSENFDTIDAALGNTAKFEKAGGTATAITLANISLLDGSSKTFIAQFNNTATAKTINGKAWKKSSTVTTSPATTNGKAYTVWYDLTGDCFFTKASAEGTAVAGNVLATKTFSNDSDTGITGTMADNSNVADQTLTTHNSEYVIPTGYHSGLHKVKAIITGLIASVIKAGTTVGGVLGTFTSDATATAAQMLLNATAYVNGNKVTGTITSKTAATYTPGTSAQTIAANQYLSGVQTILGDADLTAPNILNTANIFGVQGSAVSGKRSASGTVTPAQVATTFQYYGSLNTWNAYLATVSGLTFEPSLVMLFGFGGGLEYVSVYRVSGGDHNSRIVELVGFDVYADTGYGIPHALKADVYAAYVNSTGFALPVYVPNITYNWTAIE